MSKLELNEKQKTDENILIATATKVEALAILEIFSNASGKEGSRQVIGDKTYYDLGVHGGVPVFMVQSEMGSATPGGALLTVSQAIQDLNPQAVIMCGITFGLQPKKQRLGDIIIAKQIQFYEFRKTDALQGQISRGDRTMASERLLDRFRIGDNHWREKARTHFGLVLSGEKLVNDSDFKNSLLKEEPEAVGGDMEGAGLYAAARKAKVDWILVKAISDWGDGRKNDDVQPLAARNAAQFVLHVLQQGGWERSGQNKLSDPTAGKSFDSSREPDFNTEQLIKSISTGAVKAFLTPPRIQKPEQRIDIEKTDAAEQLFVQAYEQWLTALMEHLKIRYFDETERQDFLQTNQKILEFFLKDAEMVKELLKPFYVGSAKVNINKAKLLQRWQDLNLPQLLEAEDIKSINKAYLHCIHKAEIITSDFRERLPARLPCWTDIDLSYYAGRIKNLYQAVDLPEIVTVEKDDRDAPRMSLKDVFVAQNVQDYKLSKAIQDVIGELPEESPVTNGSDSQHSREKQSQSVLELLVTPDNKHVVLLGAPGAGKSTLARYLARSLLKSHLKSHSDIDGRPPEWTQSLRDCLSVLIELRDYATNKKQNTCRDFEEYFYARVKESLGPGIASIALTGYLENCPTLIIFDGLDEIFDPIRYREIIDEIIQFANKYPNARIIVTSLITGYQGEKFQLADFREYTLQNLNEKQIKMFLTDWFKVFYPNQWEEVELRRKCVQTAMRKSPKVRQLAGNPLLLSIIAMIVKKPELPGKRSNLYKEIANILCSRWNWDILGKTQSKKKNGNNKLYFLRNIAQHMQNAKQGAQNYIIVQELQEEMENYLHERSQLFFDDVPFAVREMIEQLNEKNVILCPYRPNIYGFIHPVFLEYFRADALVKQEKDGLTHLDKIFQEHYKDSAWHEVLCIICGLLEPDRAGELIKVIVQDKQTAYNKLKALSLAIQCTLEINNWKENHQIVRNVVECMAFFLERIRDTEETVS